MSDVVKDTPIKLEKPSTYFGGSVLKAIGDGKVGGYLIVFEGAKDSQGEYFRSDVELHLDWMGGVRRPVLYHHGLNDDDIIEDIGYVYKLAKDGHGWWCEAQLDMNNPIARQVYQDVRRNKIGWSSGSAPHLSKVGDDGGISEWALVEASLTPTPAAGKRTTVQALKFDYTSAPNSDVLSTIEPEPAKERNAKTTRGEAEKEQRQTKRRLTMNVKGNTGLIGAMQNAGIDSDSILSVLLSLEEGAAGGMQGEVMADDTSAPPPDDSAVMSAEAKDAGPVDDSDNGGATIDDKGPTPAMTPPAQSPAPAPGSKALAKAGYPDAKTLATALQIAMATMKTAPAQSKAQGFQGENPTKRQPRISDMKTVYHNMSAEDMAFVFEVRRQGKRPREMGIEFQREMAEKAMKAYQADKLDLVPEVARKVAMKLEFNNTSVAGDGASWVPDLWSSILWMRVRIDNNVAKNVEVFQMPSPTFEYPIESTDPTVYSVGESDTDAEQTLATNVFTRSKLSVTKLQFVAKKTGLQVGFSTEIEEDSIIPFIPQLRAQATRAFANSIDSNLINSDSTTGAGNINYKNANTSAVSTANFLFGGGNGMRYNALISNTNVLTSFAGGIPTLSGIRTARFKMLSATQAYGINPEDLVMITDPFTYGKFLSIDEINVYMNNGRNATVNTGLVPDIDGTPVYASQELALADNTGYALSTNYPNVGTPSSTNLGNFVIFAKNAWKVGYVRQVMTDVSYVPWNDSYILTMTARYAIGKKDTIASAVGYNIMVT